MPVLKVTDDDDARDAEFRGDLVDPWSTDPCRIRGNPSGNRSSAAATSVSLSGAFWVGSASSISSTM